MRKKVTSGEYAVVLGEWTRNKYRFHRETIQGFFFFSSGGNSRPLLRYETARLMVSAFDVGIVSGKEGQLRESIRNDFHVLVGESPFDVDGRIGEYASAIEEGAGSSKYLMNIGSVFARHVGNEGLVVPGMAASAWANSYKMVGDLLNKEIGSMEYVPYSPSNLKALLARIV